MVVGTVSDKPANRRAFPVPGTQLGLGLVILALVVLFAMKDPRFVSPGTVALVFKYHSPLAVLALGLTLVILTGGIDLSVGFLMMLLMFVMAVLARQGLSPALALLAGAASAAVIGGVVGSGVSYARIPPFILTLAVMTLAYGATLLLSGNQSVTNLPEALTWLGGTQIPVGPLSFPLMLPLVVGLYVATAVILRRTRYGRYLYALGSNREAARLNGVPVRQIEISVYVVMALCCWLAAWMQLGINRTADPKVALSDSLELSAIAMVVIGGTSLVGGTGGVGGTALGFALLSVLAVGLPYIGGQFGDVSWRKLVQGAVIAVGAVLDAWQRGRTQKH